MKYGRWLNLPWKSWIFFGCILVCLCILLGWYSFSTQEEEEPFTIEIGTADVGKSDPTFPVTITTRGGTATFYAKKNGDNGIQIYNNDGQTISMNVTPGEHGKSAVDFRDSNMKLTQGSMQQVMDVQNNKITWSMDDTILSQFVNDPIFTKPVFQVGAPQAGIQPGITTWSSFYNQVTTDASNSTTRQVVNSTISSVSDLSGSTWKKNQNDVSNSWISGS
jgi:hypothetical protein